MNPRDILGDHHPHDLYGRGPMQILRGKPIELEWAGWRSDTYRLQQHGWQFSEARISPRYDVYEQELSLQMRHPELGVSGMSQGTRRHNRHSPHSWKTREDGGVQQWSQRARLSDYGIGHLHVYMGMPFMVQTVDSPMDYAPVDTRPHPINISHPQDIYSMPYFQPIGDGKDIFLKKASVEEIMQIALDKQEPGQAEMRARRRAEEKREDYIQGKTAARLIMVA